MFINLTPHEIKIRKGKEIITIPKSGMVARVFTKDTKLKSIEGIDVYKQRCVKIMELPEEQEGIKYLVSHVVLSASRMLKMKRKDLFAPNTTTGADKTKGQVNFVDSLISI